MPADTQYLGPCLHRSRPYASIPGLVHEKGSASLSMTWPRLLISGCFEHSERLLHFLALLVGVGTVAATAATAAPAWQAKQPAVRAPVG